MKPLDKTSAYAYLNKIKTESVEAGKPVSVSAYMHKVAANDVVPTDVLIFINKHVGLPQLFTYNEVYDRRRNNPLYKNLVNENLEDENKAIALSSLLTQTFIHTKQLVKENKQSDIPEYTDIMNVKAITEALNDYANGNAKKLNEVFFEIRDLLKELYA